MKKDLAIKQLKSSFLSVEKDIGTIINKLFIESRPYSDMLKRLLMINTKDCLENQTDVCKELISNTSVKDLKEKGYLRIIPRFNFEEYEEAKSYILITMNDFTPNAENPEFRDCTISFDVICHTKYSDLGDYRIRPLKICGYIDGILNKTRLSGIGILNFVGANHLILSPELQGYTLTYRAVHGSDDTLTEEEDESYGS